MSGSFLPHLPYGWQLPFSDNALARGRQYAADNRVKVGRQDARYVEATCRGSGGNVYRQSLQLSRDDRLTCLCSCPVGLNCKHCAALILTLESQTEREPVEAADQADERFPGTIEQWLSRLPGALGDPLQAGQKWCLHYRVVADTCIEVYKLRLREDGSFGERSPYFGMREASYRQPGFMQTLDLRIAALMTLARTSMGNGFTLDGEHGGETLRLVLESGRAFLDWHQPPLQPGRSRQARFNWTQRADGSYQPSLDLGGHNAKLLTAVDPLYYLDEQENEVGLIDHGLPMPLARHLLDAPSVPAAKAALFSLTLNEIAPQLPAPARPEEHRVDDVLPVPRLSLGSHHSVTYQPGSGRMVGDHQHRAGLSFLYGQASVHGKAKTGDRIRQTEGSRVICMARQPDAEQALRQQLKQLGFRPSLRQSQALPKDSAEMFELANDAAWLHFTQLQLPQLREQGWQIIMQPGFAYDLTPVDAWYVQIDEPSDPSWFDLELGIIVEGERISLLPVLLGLIRRNPALLSAQALAQRTDDETLRVQLDKRRADDDQPLQVLLPFGRLKPILATLAELYQGQSAGENLRLGRADAARLAGLDSLALQWHGGEHLRDFAQRLRDYRQQPVSAPVGLHAQLRPYQLEGLRWMQTLRTLESGGVLGDDMGLGKTLQTLAHLLLEKESGRMDRPSLVVMPTSLIPNWQDETARFAPTLRVATLHGTARQQLYEHLGEYDLLFTTYALLPRDIELLAETPLHVLVLDEAQNIKNASSKAAQAAGRLNAHQRLCLTGTPLENHLGELWSLFHFLLPGWLGDAKRFNRDYRKPIEKSEDADRLQHLTSRIKPFLLRRRKEQVAHELPPKNEILHWVELSPAQRDLYETVRLAMDSKVREEIDRKGLARSQIVILDALLKLRQVCCDLRLVKGNAAKTARGGTSGKLDSLMEMLTELLAEGRRILLFSQFTSMLALIEDELDRRAIGYVQITGATKDRRTPVKRFQNGEVPLFLISLKAGGTGLNLTAADTVIHYDPWWNPAAENQATDRAHRIGQDKPVFVYKLIARDTVEEKIQQLQRRKAELAAGVLDAANPAGWQLDPADIEALFAPLP